MQAAWWPPRSAPSSPNPLERLNNKEIKPRTDVVGVFPDPAALLRLAGSVLSRLTTKGKSLTNAAASGWATTECARPLRPSARAMAALIAPGAITRLGPPQNQFKARQPGPGAPGKKAKIGR